MLANAQVTNETLRLEELERAYRLAYLEYTKARLGGVEGLPLRCRELSMEQAREELVRFKNETGR